MSERQEDDEEHDSEASEVLGTARKGGGQLGHGLVETDVLEHLGSVNRTVINPQKWLLNVQQSMLVCLVFHLIKISSAAKPKHENMEIPIHCQFQSATSNSINYLKTAGTHGIQGNILVETRTEKRLTFLVCFG